MGWPIGRPFLIFSMDDGEVLRHGAPHHPGRVEAGGGILHADPELANVYRGIRIEIDVLDLKFHLV